MRIRSAYGRIMSEPKTSLGRNRVERNWPKEMVKHVRTEIKKAVQS
jgi:hypothetical protein